MFGVRSGLPEAPAYLPKEASKQHAFSPYAMNGGTVLAIAGEDFAVVAADTRLSEGYSIHTRDCPKTITLTNRTVLATGGFLGDSVTLHKTLLMRLKMYKHQHEKDMSTGAIAQMLSTILYYKRFFPYYTANIIGGLDGDGRGAVYSYDPVGSYEREEFRAAGTGAALLQPLLDSELAKRNKVGVEKRPMSQDQVIALIKDAFSGVSERDIYTGDMCEIVIITKDGVRTELFPLRRD